MRGGLGGGWGTPGLWGATLGDDAEGWAFFKQLPLKASLCSSVSPSLQTWGGRTSVHTWGGDLFAGWQFQRLVVDDESRNRGSAQARPPCQASKEPRGLRGLSRQNGSIFVP